jgi:hypothetical protein
MVLLRLMPRWLIRRGLAMQTETARVSNNIRRVGQPLRHRRPLGGSSRKVQPRRSGARSAQFISGTTWGNHADHMRRWTCRGKGSSKFEVKEDPPFSAPSPPGSSRSTLSVAWSHGAILSTLTQLTRIKISPPTSLGRKGEYHAHQIQTGTCRGTGTSISLFDSCPRKAGCCSRQAWLLRHVMD